MAEPNTDLFSGSGATGVPPDEAANPAAHLELMFHWGLQASREEFDVLPKDFEFCDDPKSPILKYCNPGDYNPGGYATILGYTQAVRDAQTDTLLSTRIARGARKQSWFELCPWFEFKSDTIEQEILGAPSMTRAEYIKIVAARYDLEPELVAGLILVEQRDQSEAEDIADAIALGFPRVGTSIGLGQVQGSTAEIYGLLDDIIEMAPITPMQLRWLPLLADEAVNINATAKYLRMVADAGAEVQTQGTNSLLEKDPVCRDKHRPASGQYQNSALLNLAVMSQPSSAWSTLPDSRMPAVAPATILVASTNSTASVTQDEWDEARGHYYLQVLASEYTSCPFDPTFLSRGVRRFDKQGATWVHRDNVKITAWARFLPIAYEDCKRSGHF